MRKALFIFVLIICLTFAACGDTPVDQPDSPSVTYGNQDASAPVDSQPVDNPDNVTDTETAPNGEVVPYNELQTDMYLSSEKRVDSDGTVTEVKYTYDSEGRLLSALASDGSGNKYEYPDYSTDITYFLSARGEAYQKQVCEYDGKHQLMSNICYDGNGKLMGDGMSYSYIYSEPNMISQIRYYTTDLEHFETVDIEYTNGNVTSRVHKDENGETVQVETYEFDDKGRATLSYNKDYKTGFEYSERYEYSQDESGNTVTLCYEGDSETPSYKNIFDAEGRLLLDILYDEAGNEQTKTEVVRDGNREVTTTYLNGIISAKTESVDGSYLRLEYYDSEGNLSEYTTYEHTDTTMTEYYYTTDGNLMLLTSKTVYTNGADDRPISMHSYDAEGNVTYSNVYTYDENNCLIKEETSWDSLSQPSVVTYEYTKIEGIFRSMGGADNHD